MSKSVYVRKCRFLRNRRALINHPAEMGINIDDFFKDQIINYVKYLPFNIVKSYLKKPYFRETEEFRKNRLYKLPFMCGTIIYCYSDFHHCGYCGQADCPTETLWGLVDVNKNPKLSYYAVKEVFEECR